MDKQGAQALSILNFANQFTCIAREKMRVLPQKLQPQALITPFYKRNTKTTTGFTKWHSA